MPVLHMDCLLGLKLTPANSIDAIVTDPPYELGFMGRAWDSTGIANSVEMWAEALRVLKPGGHLLAFGGSRTYHRMACAIEDAGFDIRDQIMWVYGSGFPKSLDVSKAIDKAAGEVREVVGVAGRSGAARSCMAGDFAGGDYMATAPASDAARQWDGWGTALKPAHEPICMARKPLIGTVAANVLQHGVGALNIDGCRVDATDKTRAPVGVFVGSAIGPTGLRGERDGSADALGRWPANLIHDGNVPFPNASGAQGVVTGVEPSGSTSATFGQYDRRAASEPRREDDKSAARFFYCAKASKSDRGEGNSHPTVKPCALMRYLVRLVTPPGGTVLDPFAGSGSTGKAAKLEGFAFLGFELSAEYVAIANARIEAADA